LQVLIADDAFDHLQNTVDLLSRWGIATTTACNGAEALALASERHFDMILMDIDMPVMNGLQFTQRIRRLEIEQPERARTSIVAYTSGRLLMAGTSLQVRMGFDEVIKKPSSAPQMEACLRRWCATGAALATGRRERLAPP
jgi:CheY-like chemotaxis protein